MWKRHNNPPPILLVIGAHRDELDFGEQVSASLDPQFYSILRIPHGISGERPRTDQLNEFRKRHRELYLQILQHIEPGHRLLIDLHQGLDSGDLFADILSSDGDLLKHLYPKLNQTLQQQPGQIRCIQLVSDTTLSYLPTDADHSLVAKPDIPEEIWNNPEILYVGLEIYMENEGGDNDAEKQTAVTLIERIAEYIMH